MRVGGPGPGLVARVRGQGCGVRGWWPASGARSAGCGVGGPPGPPRPGFRRAHRPPAPGLAAYPRTTTANPPDPVPNRPNRRPDRPICRSCADAAPAPLRAQSESTPPPRARAIRAQLRQIVPFRRRIGRIGGKSESSAVVVLARACAPTVRPGPPTCVPSAQPRQIVVGGVERARDRAAAERIAVVLRAGAEARSQAAARGLFSTDPLHAGMRASGRRIVESC